MSSETFAARLELRRRLRARVGESTDEAAGPQSSPQINECLRGAARWVRDICTWKRLEAEYYFNTSVDERFYNYPTNSGPGDIIEVARWDADAQRYITLNRRIIFAALDSDPDLSGDQDAATRDKPIYYEERGVLQTNGTMEGRIELWPPADAVYKMKVGYTAGGAQMTNDADLSVVDAELVLYYATADYLDQKGDTDLAQKQRDMAERRLRVLVGAQNVGEVIVKDQRRQYDLKTPGTVRPAGQTWPQRQ